MRDCAPFRLPLQGSSFLLFLVGQTHLPRHGVFVTSSAQVRLFQSEKLLLRGRVGFVTVHAPGLINQGPVDAILAERLVHHGAVASAAQLEPRSPRLERCRGRCRVVALGAALAGHRGMDRVKENPGGIRAVRVVARHAVRFGDGVVQMLLLEPGIVRLVAIKT